MREVRLKRDLNGNLFTLRVVVIWNILSEKAIGGYNYGLKKAFGQMYGEERLGVPWVECRHMGLA